jgi:hypothetical protein
MMMGMTGRLKNDLAFGENVSHLQTGPVNIIFYNRPFS